MILYVIFQSMCSACTRSCVVSEAVIGLEVVQSGALREGGADAMLNVGLLRGGQLSAPVLVRIVTFNIDATGLYC